MVRYGRGSLVVLGVVLLAAGCGTPTHQSELHPPRMSHRSLNWGPILLSSGSVWQLNNPGAGIPRESFTIDITQGRRVRAMLYFTGFGSLTETPLGGTVPRSSASLTLSGQVSKSSLTGSNQTSPIKLVVWPVGPHVIRVTQTIAGDTADSFQRMLFHETSP